jgi:LacI family transcriptional regulator
MPACFWTMRRVALLIETDRAYGRGLLRGIARWAHLHGPWSFFVEPGTIRTAVPRLREWNCEGIVTRVPNDRVAREIASLGLPAIVLAYTAGPGQVRLGTAHPYREGQMAAEHLLDRGFRKFAFCGFAEAAYDGRRDAFQSRLAQAGLSVDVYRRPWVKKENWWGVQQQHMAEWLAGLPKPVGLFASNDDLGRRVLEACQAAGVAVPDDVAVVAVDNDELLCELCNPPLSSIALSTEKAGFEAAATLELMMAGKKPDRAEIIVEPLRVVARQSSDVMAMEDRDVAMAVRFIREHAAEPIHVEDVLDAVPISRRAMESRFRTVLGRSPNAEILRAHVDRAKMLLTTTNMAMPWIAGQSGFATPDYMTFVFQRATGMKPLQYRKHHQGV